MLSAVISPWRPLRIAGRTLCVVLLAIAAQLAQAQDCAPVPDVIVIRAIAGYSPGYRDMIARLNASGCRTRVYTPAQAAFAARKIEEDLQTGALRRPFVIVGYSLGADAGTVLSHKLTRRGIVVDRLVLVEPTVPTRVDPEVACFNIYESRPRTDWWPMLRGVPVQSTAGTGAITNYDVRLYDPGLAEQTTHLEFPRNTAVRDIVLDQVMLR